MNRNTSYLSLVQLGLAACAIYMAYLVISPWQLLAILALCFLSIGARVRPSKTAGQLIAAWVFTVLIISVTLVELRQTAMSDFHSMMALQIAIIVFMTGAQAASDKRKLLWNALGMLWGFLGAANLVAVSYSGNEKLPFLIGLATCVVLLVLCRACFRLRAFGIQLVNTLILFFVALPATALFLQWKSSRDMNVDPIAYFSYEAAKKNPGGFVRWSRYYLDQWNIMMHEVMEPDPRGFSGFRFRPGTRGHLFHSEVVINRKGFRGAEIPDRKGNAYRIVALGESTTWGCTLYPEDRPWPDLLEDMIRERIHTDRPVQVINAGVPGMVLTGNLRRLTNEILALQPDMIISYHGFNGFKMLNHDLPPIIAKPPPPFIPRPLPLLADFEYGIKLTRYKRSLMSFPVHDRPSALDPLKSDYANAYRKLIQITAQNHIQLVLANYCMAVNSNSPPELINFYEKTEPSARDSIIANMQHSEIVRELAREHPDICFVDTHPGFDGHHEYFMDLIHFTQSGRQRMAETMFQGIKGRISVSCRIK